MSTSPAAALSVLHRPGNDPRAPGDPARLARIGVLLTAGSVFLISPPGALNFLRLVPVLIPVVLLHLHLIRSMGVRAAAVRVSLPLVALLAWWLVTTTWSVDPSFTLVQTTASALAVLAGSVAGTALSRQQLLAGVALGGFLALAASVLFAVVDPAAALEQGDYQNGALHGIYVERNVLAAVLLVPTVAAVALLLIGGAERLLPRLGLAAAMVAGLLATSSSTALAAFLAATALLVALRIIALLPRGARTVVVPLLFVGVVAVAAVAASDPEAAITGLQRDSTLTGRVVIWQAAQDLIQQRPFIGFGRGVPWDAGSVVGDFMSSSVGFAVSSAHSGYLQTLLETGWVGAALLGLVVLVLLVLSVRNLIRGEFAGAWGVGLLGALVLHNYAEASILSSLTIYLLAAALAAAGRAREVLSASRSAPLAAPPPA
ncbi:O-antigen ligase family protein [uncultured Amnibacterium sp.]|uniref:O-antigen ligase family protein n=1 Tax=uncultured Amnibacterium sp. TaxID=1631851 RepID=UPI0035CA9B66